METPPKYVFNSTKQSLGQSDPSAVIRRGWREEALANQISSSGGESDAHRSEEWLADVVKYTWININTMLFY